MMFVEIFREAWAALGRNPVRSLLTMTGISWGIVAVTLLLSYGSGFRNVLMYTFEVFGKGAVVCWPGTTSEQAGGERAGKAVHFDQDDADWVKAQSPLVKRVTLESTRFKAISHEERLADTAIRGVFPEYGDMRNEIPIEGTWISAEDVAERRRVVFLGARLQTIFHLRGVCKGFVLQRSWRTRSRRSNHRALLRIAKQMISPKVHGPRSSRQS